LPAWSEELKRALNIALITCRFYQFDVEPETPFWALQDAASWWFPESGVTAAGFYIA